MMPFESRVLSRWPDIRRAVAESPAFDAWRKELPTVDVDGETLYLRGGDMLRDEDQVIFEWAQKNGMLTDEAIASALEAAEEETP